MRQVKINNRTFFYLAGFTTDCYNYIAILAEALFASYVLKATSFQMGMLGAFSALGYALPCVWTGLLSEKLGRKKMCLIAISGLTISYILAPLSSNVYMLCAISFFRSVSTSFYWPPLMAWMTEVSENGSLSGILGGYNMSWTAGVMVGFWVSGWVFQHISPIAPFYFSAIFAAITFVFIFVSLPKASTIIVQEKKIQNANSTFFVYEGLSLNFLGHFVSALALYMFPNVVGTSIPESYQGLLHSVRMFGQLSIFCVLTYTSSWHFKKCPLWICISAELLGSIFITVSNSFFTYAIGFLLIGIGGGMGYMLSAYYALALMKTKGLGSGLQESLIGMGLFAGPIYGGAIATIASPRTAIISGIIPIFLVLSYILYLEKKSIKEK